MTRWLLLLCCLAFEAAAAPTVLIADLNGRYGSTSYHERVSAMIEAIITLRPEAVIIAGDMVAGQVSPPLPDAHIDAMWQAFDKTVYQPLTAAGVAVLPVPGNHDASIYRAYSAEREAYDRYWAGRVPANLSADSNFPWFYARELAAGRMVGLDVTAPGTLSEEQVSFLAAQRTAAQTGQQRLLVATHLPLYPVTVGRERETFMSSLGPEKGELWIAGHHHAYYAGLMPGGGLQLSLPAMGGNRRAWIGGTAMGPFGFSVLADESEPALYAWPELEPTNEKIGPAAIGVLKRF